MDDTFLLFSNKNHVAPFFNYFNNKLPNINFTVEEESNNSLQFLDILIRKNETNTSTTIFRKDSYTDLCINFFSHSPLIFKINAVKTLLFRAFYLTSSYASMHDEFEYLKRFFSKNHFPSSLINNLIKGFLNKSLDPAPTILGASKLQMYISLPFYDPIHISMKKVLLKILSDSFPHINFNLVFNSSFRLGTLLSHKERVPMSCRSAIVYKFTCGVCEASYIGSTLRQFHVRSAEHRGVSPRTGNFFSNPAQSSIREHSLNSDHTFNNDNFNIIDQSNKPTDLRILEALHIKHKNPTLNGDSGAHPLLIF